jgi:hypothetical protein
VRPFAYSRDQVLDEPVAHGARGDLKTLADVRLEVAAGQEHNLLGVRRRLELLAGELAGNQAVEAQLRVFGAASQVPCALPTHSVATAKRSNAL